MKKLFLSIFFLGLFLLQTNAQAPNWLWAKSAGGTGRDRAQSIATDAGGNVYVTGYFDSPSITFGSTTFTNAGGQHFYFVKYDITGNVLWAKSAGQSNGVGISIDANGNIYVVGDFFSNSITFGNTTLLNPNFYGSIFIVKYDASGNVIWAKSGVGKCSSSGISTDLAGNVLVTGSFYYINLGTTSLTSVGVNDIFVVKYDASGNVLWAKSGGGLSDDYSRGISTDVTGNVYVSGTFYSSTMSFRAASVTCAGIFDSFVLKYDAAGNVQWLKSFGGINDDEVYGICNDNLGNVYVTGMFSSQSLVLGTTTLTYAIPSGSLGGSAFFIIKYNPAGNVLWAKSAGGTSYDAGNSITSDALGNVYVSGSFASSSITLGTVNLSNPIATGFTDDIFLVKYDASGNMLWAKSVAGKGFVDGGRICNDTNGNLFLAGSFNFQSTAIILGTSTLTNAGLDDIFVAKLGSDFVGIHEYSTNDLGINIYPNPTTGILKIENTSGVIERIEVLDIFGKTVYSSNEIKEFDLSNQPKGIYLLKTISGKKISVYRIENR